MSQNLPECQKKFQVSSFRLLDFYLFNISFLIFFYMRPMELQAVDFSNTVYEFRKKLPEIQHTQRKLLNFVF